jgi:cholestenol Delta-isomerase
VSRAYFDLHALAEFSAHDMYFPAGKCGRLAKTDRLLMCWWAFTGLTHIIIEGPFVFTPNFFKKENPNFFDEVCKFSFA